jgi:hypothetical protein
MFKELLRDPVPFLLGFFGKNQRQIILNYFFAIANNVISQNIERGGFYVQNAHRHNGKKPKNWISQYIKQSLHRNY